MKLTLAFCVLALGAIARADTVACSAGAASIPVFDPSTTSGAVGDYTLDCTGGTPAPPNSPVPEVTVDAVTNVPVLNTGGWILSDGVNMTPGTLTLTNVVEFDDVPFDPPGTGNLDFTVENILVDPNYVPPGFVFHELLTITSDFSISIANSDQVVGVNAPEPVTTGFLAIALGAFLFRRTRTL